MNSGLQGGTGKRRKCREKRKSRAGSGGTSTSATEHVKCEKHKVAIGKGVLPEEERRAPLRSPTWPRRSEGNELIFKKFQVRHAAHPKNILEESTPQSSDGVRQASMKTLRDVYVFYMYHCVWAGAKRIVTRSSKCT